MFLLSKLLRKRKRHTVLTLAACLLSAGLTLWWNLQLRDLINLVGAGVAPSAAAVGGALLTVTLTASTAAAKCLLSGCACEYMTHDLRMGCARYFSRLPFAETEQLNAGEPLSRLHNEIAGISEYFNANLFQIFDDLLTFAIVFTWLLCLSPPLTLMANVPVFAIAAYVFWASKVIGKATARGQEAKTAMNCHADTLLNLFPIIYLYDAACMTRRAYTAAIRKWERHTVASERVRARLMSLSALMSCVPLMILLFAGGRGVINGTLSLGVVYVFLNLSGQMSGVLMNMPAFIAAHRRFSANMKRLEGRVCLS